MAAELVPSVNDEKDANKKMHIFVVLPRPGTRLNPNTISLEVSSDDTVASLKARLEGIDTTTNFIGTRCLHPLPPWRQRLVLAASALPDDDDGRTLAELGVGDSSTLQLVQTQMAVFVRDPCFPGSHTLLGLSSTDTVDTVKAVYEAAKGIPADRQRLRYGVQEMRNDTTLAECGVQSLSMVIVSRIPWHQTAAGQARSRVLAVRVYGFDTVRRVKDIVEAAEGLPVAAQRAYRNGGPEIGYKDEDLHDGRTMKELGIMRHPDYFLDDRAVKIEYRLEEAHVPAEEGEERAHVPRARVLFTGTHQQHNEKLMRKIKRHRYCRLSLAVSMCSSMRAIHNYRRVFSKMNAPLHSELGRIC